MKIADIAKAAGVSPATVSRVINSRPGVSSQNVQAVRETMARLEYTPTARGRSAARLPGMRGGNLALVLVGVRDPTVPHSALYATVQHSVEMAVRERGVGFLLFSVPADGPLPPALQNGEVDGAILLEGRESSEQIVQKLPKMACVSVLAQRSAGFRGDAVLPDEEATGQIALGYLLGRGCRRMVFINALPGLADLAVRGKCFARAAGEAAVPVHMLVTGPECSSVGDRPAQVEANVEKLVEQWAGLSPRPTGMFVPSDIMAARVYRALARRGSRPGPELRIIGCNNDWAVLAGLHPRPATIDLRAAVIGRRAVDQLLWRIANPDEPGRMRILVEPALVEEPHQPQETGLAV